MRTALLLVAFAAVAYGKSCEADKDCGKNERCTNGACACTDSYVRYDGESSCSALECSCPGTEPDPTVPEDSNDGTGQPCPGWQPAHKCLGDCTNNAHDCDQVKCENHAKSIEGKFKCKQCIAEPLAAQCIGVANDPAILAGLFLGSCKHQSTNSDKCVCKFACEECATQPVEPVCEPPPTPSSTACNGGAIKCLGDCSNNKLNCSQHDCNLHARGLAAKYKCDSCTACATTPTCKTGNILAHPWFLGSCKENSANSEKCTCEFNCVNCASADCPASICALPTTAAPVVKGNKG